MTKPRSTLTRNAAMHMIELGTEYGRSYTRALLMLQLRQLRVCQTTINQLKKSCPIFSWVRRVKVVR